MDIPIYHNSEIHFTFQSSETVSESNNLLLTAKQSISILQKGESQIKNLIITDVI